MNESKDLQFHGNDPGAVRYGNFINYYEFHPPSTRIGHLPEGLIRNGIEEALSLDLGCNTGELTAALQQHISKDCSKSIIYGVDIDPVLIKRGNENKTPEINFECLDLMNDNALPVLTRILNEHGKSMFDVTFCFSMTMWIHLNHGDDGLEKFLNLISSISKVLIIEPQPWKCYRSAVKRLRRQESDFPLYDNLKIRNTEEYIATALSKSNQFEKFYESDRTIWGRKLLGFKRK